jgi:hypothetical protein
MNDPQPAEGYERCGADKKHGRGPCRLPAGHGTDHPGVGCCRRHGGNTPTHVAAAERVMAEQEARKFGLDLAEISGGEALIREVRRSAAMVDFLAALVAALPVDDLTWGVASRRIIPAVEQGGQPSVQVEQRARLHPLVVMLTGERTLLGRLSESAHRCGIEDRMMRQVELDGALIAKVVAAILNDPDLDMRPEQKARFGAVVPRHLRAMDGAA